MDGVLTAILAQAHCGKEKRVFDATVHGAWLSFLLAAERLVRSRSLWCGAFGVVLGGLSQDHSVPAMSSYYQVGPTWETFQVQHGSESEQLSGPRDHHEAWANYGEDSLSRGSPEDPRWRSPSRPAAAENYELASDASSDHSWWRNDSWSWHSWDNSSQSGSNENWVYVTRRDRGAQWQEDAWHRWHKDDAGRGAGGHRWGHCDPDDDGLSERDVAADGDELPRGELPSGKTVSVHDRADKEEEKRSTGKITSTYPPVFKAKQGENYRDWKRAVKFWMRGEGNQLPTNLVGPRVMVQLRDRAAQLVKHLEPEDVDGKEGLQLIFETLEASPLLKQNEKHRVDWHRRRLLTLNRLPGESLESYITRASLYRSQLEGLGSSLSMGERFYIGHLLDHSRLTRRDKAMIKTHAGAETEQAVTSAMVELSGELEGESGFPIGQAEPQLGGAQGEEHLVQRGVLGGRFGKTKAAYVAELACEDERLSVSALDPIAEQEENHLGEDSLEETETPLDVLHVEHEALALQFKAKQKMAEARKMRSFFKKDGSGSRKKEDQMKEKPCFACGEFGHWIRECPKVKAAMASGNQVLMATKVSKPAGDEESQQWDLLASLCQRAPTARSSATEVYMVGSSMASLGGESSLHATNLPHDTMLSMRELSKAVILDLGCMRNVAGLQWANDVVMSWKQEGRWFRIIEESETFKFGDGNTLDSKYRLQLEATFGGKRVLLAFSVVPGMCPPLLSKKSHGLLGVVIDCVHDNLSSKKLGVKAYGLTTTEGGHYMMRIDEFQHVATEHEPFNLQMEGDAEVGFILGNDGSVAQEAFTAEGALWHRSVAHGKSDSMPPVLPDRSQNPGLPREIVGRGICSTVWRDNGEDEDDGGRAQRSQCGTTSIKEEASPSCDGCEQPSREQGAVTNPGAADYVFDSTCGPGTIGGGGGRFDDRGKGHHREEESEVGQVQGQKGGECCPHRNPGRLPLFGQCLERRFGDEHREECGEQDADPTMEEVGMANACEKSGRDGGSGQDEMEEKSSLAEPHDWQRGSGFVGPLRSDEAEDQSSRGGSEVLKLERPQRGIQQRFKECIKNLREVFAAVDAACKVETRWVALEIFAGCCRFSQMAAVRDGWHVLPPVDLQLGHDLSRKEVQEEVLSCIRKYEPDLVTLSPRCGPWSQFQRLNKNLEKLMAERKDDLPLWRFARKVWDLQTEGNRLVLTENPWQSEALRLNFMVARPQLWRASVCQCAYGLRDVVSGKPHQKRTALDVNNEAMRDYLEENGVCNHGPGEHQPIEGSVHFQGRTWKRSELAARWTAKMCVEILNAGEFALTQPDDAVVPRDLAEPRWEGTQHYALPVEQLDVTEVEVRKQLEKVDWRGGRYDYVYFEGVSRQAPYRVRQALAHLHVALGHPSLDRLQRMLLVSGANNVVLQAAKGLRCQICEAVRPPGAEPKVSGERVTRFGDKVLADSFYVWDINNQRFNVTHMIDSLTEYHIGVVSTQANADATADLLQSRWCAVFGPPQVFQTDGGKEFEDVVVRVTQLLDFRHEVVPPSAKWRQGQVERHGAIVKLMMMRVIHAQQLTGLEQVRLAAVACFSSKNRLSNKMGLSPIQAVTGRNTTLPHSVMEQLGSGHVRFAVNEQLDVKDSLRRAERIRAAAVDSFHWIDSNEVLRRALHARSRPPKLEMIQEGATVYVHSPPPHRRGQARRLQDHSSWDGPGLVVCVERQRDVPNRVWVRIRSKVRSYPLEKIRLATPDEMLGSNYITQMLEDMSNEIKEGKLMVENGQKNPPAGPPEVDEEEKQAELALKQMDEERRQEMRRKIRRMEMLDDVPVQIRSSSGGDGSSMSTPESKGLTPSSTSASEVAIREKVAREKRRLEEHPEELEDVLGDDECDPHSMEEDAEGLDPSRLTLKEKQDFFQQAIDDRQGKPSKLGEAKLRGKLEKSVKKMRGIKQMIQKGRAMTKRQTKEQRHEAQGSNIMVMYAEADKFEEAWVQSCEAHREQEAFWTTYVLKDVYAAELDEMTQQVQKQHQEDGEKANIVTGRARLEYNWNKLSPDWQAAFQEPLLKAVRVYFEHDAVTGVAEHKLVDSQRILSSRFVLTNKGEAELAQAILKARWVLGGHKDPDIGRFPTLAGTYGFDLGSQPHQCGGNADGMGGAV